MADLGLRIDAMPLKPTTRVRYSAAAVQRAEEALRQARLDHADTIRAAHEKGLSLAQIGQALGVSRQRVHALLVWAAEQREEV